MSFFWRFRTKIVRFSALKILLENVRAFWFAFFTKNYIFYSKLTNFHSEFSLKIDIFLAVPEFSSSRNPEVSSSISPVGNSWMGFSFSTLIVRLIFLLCPACWPEPIIWEQFRTFSFMLHRASEEKSQISFASFSDCELHSIYILPTLINVVRVPQVHPFFVTKSTDSISRSGKWRQNYY